MKNLKKLTVLLFLITAAAAYPVEIETAAEAGNFAFTAEGVLKKMPDFGLF